MEYSNQRLKNALPVSFTEENGPVCIIVGAGDFGGLAFLPAEDDFVIAADGGYAHLQKVGIRCDLLMGDLDSLPPETKISAETRRYSPIKDDTDTMLAVRYGLEHGYRKFCLYGIFGGRFDHTVAAIQTVLFLCGQGAEVCAFESRPDGTIASYMTAVKNGTLLFSDQAEGYVSLFALEGEAHGVTLSHLKYPMTDGVFYPDVALGVSNEFLPGEAAEVTVSDGILLLVKPL